jgi:hypothetical protein
MSDPWKALPVKLVGQNYRLALNFANKPLVYRSIRPSDNYTGKKVAGRIMLKSCKARTKQFNLFDGNLVRDMQAVFSQELAAVNQSF